MPRDYKRAPRQSTPRRVVPGWVWMLAGLAVGLFVAFLVYLDKNAGSQIAAERPAASAPPGDRRPAPKPRKEGRPRFEFYTILPEVEVRVSDADIQPRREPPASATAEKVSGKGVYILQVGSFRSPEQADRLKASLALIGLEAGVQKVALDGNETWHRVRLGPFKDTDDVNAARTRLRENGHDAVVLRIKS